jgi:cytochrome c oxidase subunit 2
MPFGAAQLLALACVVVQGAAGAQSTRTIDVTLTRYAFSPERVEVHLGERVQLHVVSGDRMHGFEVKALGLAARIPAGGQTVTVDLMPNAIGTFAITCSEYCGAGHSRMKAWLVVTPPAS